MKSAAIGVSVLLGANMKDMINNIKQRDKKVEEKNLREDTIITWQREKACN